MALSLVKTTAPQGAVRETLRIAMPKDTTNSEGPLPPLLAFSPVIAKSPAQRHVNTHGPYNHPAPH
jgi:hypothetical protein